MEKVLEVSSINFRFKKKEILKNVNFHVASGEIVGLLGANGAGKSTCMKIVAGLYQVSEGTVELFSKDPFDEWYQLHQKVGILFEPHFPGQFTAEELMRQIAMLKNENTTNLLKLLEICGLANVKKKKIKHYSFGMKQRLGLATALIGNPQFLMLDEPFVGLDPIGIQELQQLLLNLAHQGTAIFISSHQLSELQDIVSRIIFLQDGEIKTVNHDVKTHDLKKLFEMR